MLTVLVALAGVFVTLILGIRQIGVAEKGQVTDRYIRAVDQLGRQGSAHIQLRIGAIYALKTLMEDSDEYQPIVVEVLAAFLRDRDVHGFTIRQWDAPVTRKCDRRGTSADYQAAMEVLGRRNIAYDGSADLDLRGACLAFANLEDLSLTRSNLAGADLHGANLAQADLRGATLNGADLARSELNGAKLGCVDGRQMRRGRGDQTHNCTTMRRTDLRSANLRGADLNFALLPGTDLSGADLHGADLSMASIDDAVLVDANLGRVDLRHAEFLGANLGGADLEHADLRHAELVIENLKGASMVGADLRGADLRDANLNGVVLHDARHDRHTLIGDNRLLEVRGSWW